VIIFSGKREKIKEYYIDEFGDSNSSLKIFIS
jgi:hypothetical protein